mgnify:CR=1 FL=1|tara:strand:- start:445 stop:1935 length:1491 start_codon:yes stop_codon:yes gene_type:complete
MQKSNILAKKLRKQIQLINNSIENYFNKIKSFKTNLKKTKFDANSRLFYGLGALSILTLAYFLMPTLYDKNVLETKIKNQIFERYGIEINFNDDIKYSFFPKPNFYSKNLSIVEKNNDIAKVKNFKIFISINRLFEMNYLLIKDVQFEKADFNINKNDFNFFKKLMFIKPNNYSLSILKSNIFFNNENDEILFINKVDFINLFYDEKNLQNILFFKNEIFNIPFKFKIRNKPIEKKFTSTFNSKKIRLNIENEFDYKEKIKKGLLSILLINKDTKLNYEINNNSMIFNSLDEKKNYNGNLDFKPFYLSANFNYENMMVKNLLKSDSIIVDLFKSEILNNKNLNINTNFKIKNINDINEFNQLDLNLSLSEGNISPSNSSVMWKDDLKINLDESYLIYDKNEIYLVSKIIINLKDAMDFFSFFQVPRKNRKAIKKIEFDLNYNISNSQLNFDNIVIDNKENSKLNDFVNDYNSFQKKNFNKVRFRNFINDLFESYDG